ncbi:MAG: hypothetical protein F2774_03925 [Actinobacteria bacterium]|uniref:Unannotated protein n=1 Tax=freshwater metagenome TaxID=449393 RepID=A0A6J7BSY3_9ZZZZ|nr:hypothetical protein [Actinomycetota bacterium]
MSMQYDVKQGHLNSSGYFVNYPVRVKGVSFAGSASAGTLVLFDTSSTPVSSSVTYAQTANTVTVTKTAHGLTTGTVIGIHFATNSGVSATDGTYVITKTGADTFTLTDVNSRSIASTAAVYTVGKWLLTYESTAGDVYTNVPFIPGEGIRAETGVYALMTNLDSAQIIYG